MDPHAHAILDSTAGKIIGTVLASAGATVLARLKKKGWVWANPVLYGLGGFCLIMFGLIALQWWVRPIEKPPELTTSENVETRVREWLDALGVGVQRKSPPDAHFSFWATMQDSTPVSITRGKQQQQYLILLSQVGMGPEDALMIAKMPVKQARRMYDEIMLEMARSRITFKIDALPDGRIKTIAIGQHVLIDGLTEDILSRRLAEMDTAVVLAKEAIRIALGNASGGGTKPLQ